MAERESVVLNGMKDLTRYGINPLTGEACAYSERVLCDVSEKGRAFLTEYFGQMGFDMPRNMNSKVGEDDAIGSIMLPRELFAPLARFGLLHIDRFAFVVTSKGGEIMGLNNQEYVNRYREMGYTVQSNFALTSQAPMVNSRNVHAFTGRAY